MKHKTIIQMRSPDHGVFMIGVGDWQYRKDAYHACGAFRVIDGGRGVEVGPFAADAPGAKTEKERHEWMARNWLSARKAFRAMGFEFWSFERREDDETFTPHKVTLTGVSEPAKQQPDAGGQRSGVHEMKATVYVESRGGKKRTYTWSTFNVDRKEHRKLEDGLSALANELGDKWAKEDGSEAGSPLEVTVGLLIDGGQDADAGQTFTVNGYQKLRELQNTVDQFLKSMRPEQA